jgi:hypothetical protein
MSLAFLIAVTLIQLHQQFPTSVPKTERVRECHSAISKVALARHSPTRRICQN